METTKNNTNLITVILITYNHEDYLQKSIESVLEQETNFQFSLQIYDDASTDGTSEIIRKYAKLYPQRITAHINKNNIGFIKQIYTSIKNVDTKYYAFLEGDDYWCNKYKLQKQYEILEKNPDCSFCGHNTIIKSEKNTEKLFECKTKKIELNNKFKLKKDFIKIHPSSRLYRTDCIDFNTLKEKEIICWDSTSFWYFLSKGKLYYIDEVMSVYNYTKKGIFSGADNIRRNQMSLHNIYLINKELEYKYNNIFYKLFSNYVNFSFIEKLLIKYVFNKKQLNRLYTKKLQTLYPIRYFMSNGENNFGDELNRYILNKITNNQCINTSIKHCNFIAIGSILDQYFFKDKGIKIKNKKLTVWGSGMISEETNGNEQFNSKMEIYALRGHLTKLRCENILKMKLNNITIGDPALLANELIDKENIQKEYDVGIIPHYLDKNSEFLENIKLNKYKYEIINITEDPIFILNEISKCKCVLSSALHGLIVSDSLNIPNKWIKLSNNLYGNDYKFKDYYSVYQLKEEQLPIDLRKREITDKDITSIIQNYKIKSEDVEEIRKNLKSCFPHNLCS